MLLGWSKQRALQVPPPCCCQQARHHARPPLMLPPRRHPQDLEHRTTTQVQLGDRYSTPARLPSSPASLRRASWPHSSPGVCRVSNWCRWQRCRAKNSLEWHLPPPLAAAAAHHRRPPCLTLLPCFVASSRHDGPHYEGRASLQDEASRCSASWRSQAAEGGQGGGGRSVWHISGGGAGARQPPRQAQGGLCSSSRHRRPVWIAQGQKGQAGGRGQAGGGWRRSGRGCGGAGRGGAVEARQGERWAWGFPKWLACCPPRPAPLLPADFALTPSTPHSHTSCPPKRCRRPRWRAARMTYLAPRLRGRASESVVSSPAQLAICCLLAVGPEGTPGRLRRCAARRAPGPRHDSSPLPT